MSVRFTIQDQRPVICFSTSSDINPPPRPLPSFASAHCRGVIATVPCIPGFDVKLYAAYEEAGQLEGAEEDREKLSASIAGMTLAKLGFQTIAPVLASGAGTHAGAGEGAKMAGGSAAAAAAAAAAGPRLRKIMCEALNVPPGRTLASALGSTESLMTVKEAQNLEKKARQEGCRDSVNCESVIEMGISLERLAEVLRHYHGQF